MTNEQIYGQICNILEKMNIKTPQADSQKLDMDSIVFMMAVYELENAFGIKFDVSDFQSAPSLAYLTELIKKKL